MGKNITPKVLWEAKKQIVEGITNTFVKNSEIEAMASGRLAICEQCPYKSKNCSLGIAECCSLCGCSLKFKSRSPYSTCPDGRWPIYKEE